MCRLLLVSVAVLATLAGCQASEVSRLDAVAPPAVSEPRLDDYALCAHAIGAVRRIVAELFVAPDDEALVAQTVTSYTRYAVWLRELAALADNDTRRASILRAADAAERYALEVRRSNSYHVDIEPVIAASNDAFPGCDLNG